MESNQRTSIMMTQQSAEPPRVCPQCGHVGHHPTQKLPSPEYVTGMGTDGLRRNYYRVNVGEPNGPEQYQEFAQEPSRAEIEHAVAEAARNRQSKRKG